MNTIFSAILPTTQSVEFTVGPCDAAILAEKLPRWTAYIEDRMRALSRHPAWLSVLNQGLRHDLYCVEATIDEQTVGLLPLAHVKSLLFGRFLVSLPYLNTAGAMADDENVARGLIDRAVELADSLNVRYLELRHELPIEHPALTKTLTTKVHMRLALRGTVDDLWKDFDPKVRNQVRKGEKLGLTVHWGESELLDEFYRVFARNMRDLGTPVYSRKLFQIVLRQFPGRAELCVVRHEGLAVAAGLLVHGNGVSEVLSAGALRTHNFTNANMLMYWHLLQRAVGRGQQVFDFGRCSLDNNVFRFKRQWGARPEQAAWQYYVRKGTAGDLRPENSKYSRLIRVWQRLPVLLTQMIGPPIVRGIP